MAKLNANYEAVYIIDPRKNEEETAALMERFKTLAEGNATGVEVDEWGKRSLAYPIQDQTGQVALWLYFRRKDNKI